MKRRLFAIAMTLAMALSLLPTAALAEEADPATGTLSSVTETDEPGQPDPTAEVPGTENLTDEETSDEAESEDAAITTQETLKAAIDTAPDGGTVTLDGNIDITEPIVITKELTLDLNGKTIAPAENTTIWKDDKENNISHWSLIRVAESGNLTITGEGTLQAAKDDSYAIDLYDEASQCTIENGTFVGNIHAVYVRGGTLTVNGGTFSVQQKYSEEYPDEYVLNCYDDSYKDGTASITVNGGTFVGFNPSNCRAEGAGTDFCAPGYIVEEDSTGGETSYTVTKLSAENAVAQVGDDYYATLAEALEDAQDNETVKLLKDTVITPVGTESNNLIPQITISSDVTIDLNGKQVTTAGSAIGYTPVLFNIDGATVTITGNGTIDVQTVGAYDDGEGCYGINITNNGSLTIENGTFTGAPTAVQVTAGTLTILGGTFRLVNIEMDEEDLLYMSKFVVNCIDSNFANGTARIYIKGGSFCFDPDGKPEASDITYVPAGYESVQTENGMWTVGPKTDGMEADASASGGTASADVGGSFIVGQLGEDGVSTESTTVKINVTTGEGGAVNDDVTTTNVTIASGSLTSVQTALNSNDNLLDAVEIATDVGTLTVDKTAWDTITEKAANVGENVPVTLSISQAQEADSGSNKPLAYELTAKASETDVFAQGSAGTITVDVPYTGTTAHVYYVGDDGAEQVATPSVSNGRISWNVTHFSTYVVTQDETGAFGVSTEDGDTTITSYETLDAALTALAGNENNTVTISLLDGSTHTLNDANYTVKAKLTISGNATINATPASGQRTKVFTIVNNGKLTLNDLTLNMKGTTNADDQKKEGDGINVKYGAELVLNNATVTFENMFSPMVFEATSGITTLGKVTVNNSKITATGTRGNFSNGGEWTIENNSSVTIDGCGTHGLSVETVTINNSEVTVKNTSWVGVYGSKINLENGATLEVTNCATDENIGENYKDKGAVQIKSSEESSLTVTDSTMTLSNNGNGASEGEQSIYVPAGATYTNNGTVTGTVTSSGEAMIDGKVYDTLAKAIENAQNGDVVTLLKDVELDGTDKNNNEGLLDISKSITLDGNEHKITAKNVTVAEGTTNGPSMINITGNVKVTVRDLKIDGESGDAGAAGNTKHGLNIYGGADVTVENVTIQNGNGYAIVANGSTVTVNGLTTSNNSWGGINVDSKSGEASLTVEDATIHENNSIKFENSSTAPKNDDPSAEIKDGDFQYITAGSEIDTENLDLTISGGTFATGSYEGALSVGNYLEDGLAIDSNGNVYQPSQGGSSGGSSVTRYTVSVPSDIEGGSVRVSPTRASRGQTVTITVDPDDGYELDRLVVRDADGDRIDLERKSDTKYTFEMPRGKVTVEATFTEIEEEDAIPFRDVDTDDWFYDAVVYAYDNDLMSGVSNDQFAPDATLTRAMVAQMLYSLEGKPRTGSAGYADVAFGAWYEDAVAWISSEGLMTGYSDTAFGPDDPLTREQLALILYNYADWAGYDVRGSVSLGSYIDADSASTWAVEALEWAIDAGLISGRGDGILAPAGTATRAEVAQIFMNFLENVAQ